MRERERNGGGGESFLGTSSCLRGGNKWKSIRLAERLTIDFVGPRWISLREKFVQTQIADGQTNDGGFVELSGDLLLQREQFRQVGEFFVLGTATMLGGHARFRFSIIVVTAGKGKKKDDTSFEWSISFVNGPMVFSRNA